MTEHEIKAYLAVNFPIENESCEWKEFSNLKHFVRGKEGEDIISYISALSNMEGGSLIIGVEDKSLTITGIQDFGNFTKENRTSREEVTFGRTIQPVGDRGQHYGIGRMSH